MLDTFSELQAEPERLVDAGDQVVVLYHWRGEGKGSGLSLGMFGRQAAVFTLRDGKAIKVEWYLDPAAGFEAAGVSE
jgi:ketosteroid isomerase-like protein